MSAICRGCGRPIVWAETSAGKNVPLDPRAVVYSVVMERGKRIAVKPTPGVFGEEFMVSHFNTCPKANDFSGSKRPSTELPFDRHFSEPEATDE